jgi:hypothetical protein
MLPDRGQTPKAKEIRNNEAKGQEIQDEEEHQMDPEGSMQKKHNEIELVHWLDYLVIILIVNRYYEAFIVLLFE